MAFYGERFRRPDEEDIWEELAKMISNPPSEAELMQKKKEEQAWIDSILEQAFPEEAKPQKEPYLTYEELMDGIGDKTLHGQPTGMAVPVQKGYVTNVKPTPYEEIDAKLDWSEDFKAQKKSEVNAIQEAARVREKEINREHLLEQAKNYGGAALEIGSAFVPGYGGAKVAGTLAKKLAPTVGRKIAKEIATGTLKGASSGTVEGLGRGLLEDENPLKTAVQDTAIGTTLGAGLGATGANIQKGIRKSELRKYDNLLKNKKLNKQEKKEFIKAGNKYYQDYEQGVETKVNGLGNIKLTSDALKETITQKPEHIIDVLDLSKNLKKSKVLGVEPPKHSHKYDITKFHHLGGEKVDYQIAENRKGDKYFYKITDPYLTGPKPEGEGLLNTPKSANNIIPSSQNNLNPTTSGTQPNNQIPTLESEEEWLKRLRRQRQRRGFF